MESCSMQPIQGGQGSNHLPPSQQRDSTTPTCFDLSRVTDVLWTLTDRCNLRCVYCTVVPHCGPPSTEPSIANIQRVLDQLARLPKLESVIISGGEALLSPHLEHVLAHCHSLAPVQYLITNGTTLRGQAVKDMLKRHRPRIMVTVDSMLEPTNAMTRGAGVLGRTLETLKWLLVQNFFTIVITVFTRYNAKSIGDTLESLYNMGVRNFLIQQLHCSDPSLRQFFLSASPSLDDIRNLRSFLQQFRASHPDAQVDDNEICFFENRRREFERKCDGKYSYRPQRLFMCGAGYNFFAIKANGDVIPCNAFLDCVVGNLHKENIEDILSNSPTLIGLRNLRTHRVDEISACANCDLNPICDGGCRADVYNLTGEIGDPHPYCPRLASEWESRFETCRKEELPVTES